MTHSLSELTFWWTMLLDSADLDAAQAFLKVRAEQGPKRIMTRYGLLL